MFEGNYIIKKNSFEEKTYFNNFILEKEVEK